MKKYGFACIFFAGVCAAFLLAMMETAVASASLNDYWIGNADWKFVRKWSLNDLGGATELDGIHIEVEGNDWYLFTRKMVSGGKMGTEVRHATAHDILSQHVAAHRVWGSPKDVVIPEAGTPWAYSATDGQPCDDASDRPGYGWTEINTIETS